MDESTIQTRSFPTTSQLLASYMSAASKPSCAPSPFDHVKADVIFRSSDDVDFRVFKLFLSLASPFFDTLFNLPQPSEEMSTDGLPVIPVSEDSKTLDPLLRFCYPCTLAVDPALEDFRDVINVLETAKKYSLDAVERTVCKYLFNSKILETNSLQCFAIACRARMQDECVLAARHTLREPLVPTWFEEIELITSTQLLALLTYHRKCATVVQALKDDFVWITTEYPQWEAVPWMVALGPDDRGSKAGGSKISRPKIGRPGAGGSKARESNSRNCCTRSSSGRYPTLYGYAVAQWWEAFMDSTFLDLQNKPCTETIRHNVEKAIQTVRQGKCGNCISSVPGGMRDFGTLFIKKVEELVAKVELDLKF